MHYSKIPKNVALYLPQKTNSSEYVYSWSPPNHFPCGCNSEMEHQSLHLACTNDSCFPRHNQCSIICWDELNHQAIARTLPCPEVFFLQPVTTPSYPNELFNIVQYRYRKWQGKIDTTYYGASSEGMILALNAITPLPNMNQEAL